MIAYSELLATPVAAAQHRFAYGSGTLQFGELRLPEGSEPVPLIVLIHGGCWRSQYDLAHVAGAAVALADEGFAVWTIEYRRIGDADGGWPGTFDDIAHGVDYVRHLADAFPRIDTARVVLMGHSAGGQLALWAASRQQNDMVGLFRSAVPPLKVAGVVSLAGITDLAAYGAGGGSCNQSVTPLLGGTMNQVPQRYHAVSPVERVPIGASIRLVHGDVDPIVPISQSTEFLARARMAGDRAELDVIKGGGHFDLVAPQSAAWPTVVRAARWSAGVALRKTPGHSGL